MAAQLAELRRRAGARRRGTRSESESSPAGPSRTRPLRRGDECETGRSTGDGAFRVADPLRKLDETPQVTFQSSVDNLGLTVGLGMVFLNARPVEGGRNACQS